MIGVDMTPGQLAVARATLDWHRARFGAACPEIAFHDGLIERLDAPPVAPGSVDIVVSNCVVNLSPEKAAVLAGAHRLLKPGGEMHFADVYADRDVPEALRADPVLHGECLSGPLTRDAVARTAAAAGFAAPRVVAVRPLSVGDPEPRARLGDIRFAAVTCRLIRPGAGTPRAATGGRARHPGGLDGAEDALALDAATRLPAGAAVPVGPRTLALLAASRFAPALELTPVPGAARGEAELDPFAMVRAPGPAGRRG